jgi:NAD-dependent SIR2 family protein deacetylase
MDALDQAAQIIADANALVFAAGAGIGVDSGLPDFRGDEGFWNAYPPYRHLGVSFVEMANPQWFAEDPEFAWGFYGHRRNLYRDTAPHHGFELMRTWGARKSDGHFVFTSNVDSQFQRAGFAAERVVECHGTIEFEQCMNDCGVGVFDAPAGRVEIDERSMRATGALPRCPQCGSLARPNILMFGDWGWDASQEARQSREFDAWRRAVDLDRVAVIECGAGTHVPSVRWFSEQLVSRGAQLIRINPRESQAPNGQVSIAAGALEALEQIEDRLGSRG